MARTVRNAVEERIAQQLAAQLVAAQPPCAGRAGEWMAAETAHRKATTRAQAVAAAGPLMPICGDCPAVRLCGQWARIDRYTGIAAGLAWANGKPNTVGYVPRDRKRRRVSRTVSLQQAS